MKLFENGSDLAAVSDQDFAFFVGSDLVSYGRIGDKISLRKTGNEIEFRVEPGGSGGSRPSVHSCQRWFYSASEDFLRAVGEMLGNAWASGAEFDPEKESAANAINRGLTCPVCGTRMQFQYSKSRGKQTGYFECSNRVCALRSPVFKGTSPMVPKAIVEACAKERCERFIKRVEQ